MKFAPKQLNEIKQRRQFRSDTDALLICDLIDEVVRLNDNRKSLAITYVELFLNYFELLDDQMPDWRVYCKSEIDVLLKKLEGDK
jgi:hypothetical protein